MTISRRKFLTMAAAAPLVAKLPIPEAPTIQGTWMSIEECLATWTPAPQPRLVHIAWIESDRAWRWWVMGVEKRGC